MLFSLTPVCSPVSLFLHVLPSSACVFLSFRSDPTPIVLSYTCFLYPASVLPFTSSVQTLLFCPTPVSSPLHLIFYSALNLVSHLNCCPHLRCCPSLQLLSCRTVSLHLLFWPTLVLPCTCCSASCLDQLYILSPSPLPTPHLLYCHTCFVLPYTCCPTSHTSPSLSCPAERMSCSVYLHNRPIALRVSVAQKVSKKN